MNAEEIKKQHGHLTLGELPEDLRAAVQADPDLQAWFEGMDSVRLLMQLKRHENIPDKTADVVRHRVGIRLNQVENPAPETPAPGIGRWLG